jgi:CheY-like chemotaxis protein/tRNA A-37 threonylcarbamoyl transferase component Bud32
MDNLDGSKFGELAVRLGLLNETRLRDVLGELGGRNPPLDALITLLERRGLVTPWQTAKIKRGDGDGFYLGGCRILYRVAAGTFGRVYRAEDPRSGRQMALKVLRRKWTDAGREDNRHVIENFLREGKLGLELRHPNIVEVTAVDQDPVSQQYFIAMEFVEGGNLREILQIRKRLDVPEALQLLEEAAAGLAYAFSKGVTHRDVKLTNLLVSAQGHCKLVDFGLAQLFETVANTRQEKDRISRTVDYAGLERATGVKEGDVRSDIYFLGCVFYEMLTGRSPLTMTRARSARMLKTRFEEVCRIGREELTAPPSVFLLAETMMTLDPSARYQTLTQLLDAIRAARRDLEDGARRNEVAGSLKRRTVFVVEKDERLLGQMRERFRELGYRVLIARDPSLALQRFRQQPYDALVVDAGTTDVEGREAFDRVLTEVGLREYPFAGVLLLSEDQAGWRQALPRRREATALTFPTTVKRIHREIGKLLAAG